MSLLPLPPPPRPAAGPPAVIAFDLVAAILASLAARTARTYLTDYRDFARFLGQPDPPAALDLLIGLGPGPAHACALAYRVHLADRGLAPGTIARRLVALRSAVKIARRLGRVSWSLEVPGPKPSVYRDTRGPGRSGWLRLLATAQAGAAGGTPKGVRDLAILRLLHDLALRRGEVVGLDRADVETDPPALWVLGKGRTAKERLTLPAPTAAALAGWLAVRGDQPGPLFRPLDPGAAAGDRLTGEAVRRILRALSARAGLETTARPHGLRHQAITSALDAGNDVRRVRKFSRHIKIDTLLIYDDNRQDIAGAIARDVAGA